MRRNLLTFATIGVGVLMGLWLAKPGSGFAAVPGEKRGWDLTGPYEVVPNWPRPMSQGSGHEK